MVNVNSIVQDVTQIKNGMINVNVNVKSITCVKKL